MSFQKRKKFGKNKKRKEDFTLSKNNKKDIRNNENVLANYQSIPYVVMLELILILLAVHGFNGLRVILLELKQGRVYEKAVSYGCVVGMIALIGYGSRTIIMTNMGMS